MTASDVIVEKLENIQFSIGLILDRKDTLEEHIAHSGRLAGRYGRANEIIRRLYELENWMGDVQQDLAPIKRTLSSVCYSIQ